MKGQRQTWVMAAVIALLIGSAAAHAQEATPGDAGQLAIVGADGNIHLYHMASGTFTALTDDAAQGERAYAWPTWSNDGRLAYFGVSAQRDDPYRLGIFIKPAAGDAVRAHAALDEVFTYAHWAPADCPAGNCRDLAVLYTNASGNLAMRLVRSGAEITVTEVEEGGPFYWDWSPDGQSMFWARFGLLLERYDVATNQVVEVFPEMQGPERAVDWSPVDDRLLSVVRLEDGTANLVVFDGAARQAVVEGLEAGAAFEWSPDGARIAYVDVADDLRLNVIDARTGSLIASPATGVFAFFWSPDGARIAYLALEAPRVTPQPASRRDPSAQPDAPRIQWFVYDLAADRSDRSAAFVPTADMIYYLQFFDQFARSHRLWSPDSRYLVYAERLRDGRDVVSLIDVNAPDAPPQILMEGSMGVFGW